MTLRRVRFSCPHCDTPPRLKLDSIFAEFLSLIARDLGLDADCRVLTYQCHKRVCQEREDRGIYDIPYRALIVLVDRETAPEVISSYS